MVKDTSSLFPWDQIKAESMRSVCRDLGLKLNPANRAMMTHFLERVYKIGLPKALAQDGTPDKNSSTRKRTRGVAAAANTPILTRSGRSSPNRRNNRSTKREAEDAEEYQEPDEDENEDEDEDEEDEEQEPEPEPEPETSTRKRLRGSTSSTAAAAVGVVSVTSDYNTRFKADRRGRMSDLGRRTRSSRSTTTATATTTTRGRGRGRGGEMMSISAPVTPRPSRHPRRPAAKARSRGVSARRASISVGGSGRRVRVAEPVSSETEDEEESASAVTRKKKRRGGLVPDRSPARKRLREALVNGADGEGNEEVVVVAAAAAATPPRKRAMKTTSTTYSRARKRITARMSTGTAKRVVAEVGPKLVFDGIDVPPLSKAMVAAIKRKDMVLGDEDADGEVEAEVEVDVPVEEAQQQQQRAPEPEPEPEAEPEHEPEHEPEPAVEQGEDAQEGGGIAPEGGEEPEGGDEAMPVDEAEDQVNIAEGEGEEDEDEEEFGDIIPDDTSSLGNSNKENEAPEEDQEMDNIGAAMMSIDEELGASAAEALFGASTSAVSVPVQSDGEPSNVTEEDDLNSFLT